MPFACLGDQRRKIDRTNRRAVIWRSVETRSLVIVKLLGHVLWDMERAIRMDVAGTCPGGATKVVAGARNFRELTLNCPI